MLLANMAIKVEETRTSCTDLEVKVGGLGDEYLACQTPMGGGADGGTSERGESP